MKLSNEDRLLLKDLCKQHEVSFEKVINLLEVIKDYEIMDRRIGIYDALRQVLKRKYKGEADYEV